MVQSLAVALSRSIEFRWGARIVGVQVDFQGVQSWSKGSGTCSVDRFEGFLLGRWAAKGSGERGSGLGIGMRLARSAMGREMGGEFRCVGNVYCGG